MVGPVRANKDHSECCRGGKVGIPENGRHHLWSVRKKATHIKDIKIPPLNLAPNIGTRGEERSEVFEFRSVP
jgi:hypothetical protein